ncbi:MAG: ABC transporter permease [Planctomycetes bacterium]|jgi:lipoprotein-releasing system permease protein|nr:ABC transporter permease [Planctomycetota bacterium]
MLKLFLWLKYIRRRRIILMSVIAVAVSVALLIVVASLFTGFIAAFQQSAVDTIGDIIIAPEVLPIEKYPVLIAQLEQTGVVEAATATLTSAGLLHLGPGNVRPVSIWGIQPERRARVMGFQKSLLCQSRAADPPSFRVAEAPDSVGGFVGIGLLGRPDERTDEYDQDAILKEMLGKRVLVTAGTAERTPEGAQVAKKRTIPFRIVDVVFRGVYQLDSSTVFLPIEVLQKELYPAQTGDVANSVSIKLKPGVDPEAALAQIRKLWETFAAQELLWGPVAVRLTSDEKIKTAQEMQRIYVAEFEKQKDILEVIFSVISFGVVVLVFCIFYMMVKLKQKDIAIVISCGASSSSVIGLFLGFGVSVGVAGSGLGAALGYLITRHIEQVEHGIRILFGLKLWRSSVYMFSEIPNQIDWGSAAFFGTMAMAGAAVGALVPALVAACTRPVEVLRNE